MAEIGFDHLGVLGDGSGCALGDHAALVQHIDAFGERRDGLHHMLDQQHRDARGADLFDDLDNVDDLGGVEARHHLVEQQKPGLGGECAGQFQALAPRHGEVGAELVELARHADLGGDLFGKRHRLAAAGGAEVGAHHDVLAHRDLGEGLGDLERPHHARAADLVRRQAGDVAALEGNASGIGCVKARDRGKQRGLARASGADQRHDLAGTNVERRLIDGLQAAEGLAEIADLKHAAVSGKTSSQARRAGAPRSGSA